MVINTEKMAKFLAEKVLSASKGTIQTQYVNSELEITTDRRASVVRLVNSTELLNARTIGYPAASDMLAELIASRLYPYKLVEFNQDKLAQFADEAFVGTRHCGGNEQVVVTVNYKSENPMPYKSVVFIDASIDQATTDAVAYMVKHEVETAEVVVCGKVVREVNLTWKQ